MEYTYVCDSMRVVIGDFRFVSRSDIGLDHVTCLSTAKEVQTA